MIPPAATKNYMPIQGEKWKQAEGYSPNYYVSNMGRILTLTAHNKPSNPAIMKPAQDFDKRRNEKGYLRTVMDGKSIRVHRIVAQTWIPNPDNKPFVNHKNGDKADNRVDNLEWCDNSENMVHAYRHGLIKVNRGDNNCHSRLTEEQVRCFKREWKYGRKMTRKEYAKKLGVSEATLKDIIRGRSWGWLKIA